MPGIFSRGHPGANAPVIPPKVPTPGPEAPVEEAADSLPEPVPFVRPNDEERVAADVDEVGGRVAVDEVGARDGGRGHGRGARPDRPADAGVPRAAADRPSTATPG